jgi:DNA-binding beta-propeller fold protein YncE
MQDQIHNLCLRLFFASWTAALLTLFPVTGTQASELTVESIWSNQTQSPTRIAIDPTTNLIYVTCPRTGKIVELDTSGTVLNEITSLADPCAIATDGNGQLWVTTATQLHLLTTAGTSLVTIGDSILFPRGTLDLTVGSNGQVYVSRVTENILISDSILIFNAGGELTGGFGGFGRWWQTLNVPIALAANPSSELLYVLDQDNYRVMVFDPAGNGITEWGRIGNGNYAPAEFLRPWAIDVDNQGRVWIFDSILNSFQVFLPDGTFLGYFTLDHPALRTGLDFAILNEKIYLVSSSLDNILVLGFDDTELNHDVNLVIHSAGNDIVLNWNPVGGAISYRILRSPDFADLPTLPEILGTTPDTSFSDIAVLSNWFNQFYAVQPVFIEGGAVVREIPIKLAHEDPHRETASHESPHQVWEGVTCLSCHYSWYDYPDPLPDWWFGDHLCKSCHIETGMASAQQNHLASTAVVYCTVCHDPHHHQSQFPRYFIRDAMPTSAGVDREVLFNHAGDYVHGAPDFDGICEVCHTQTLYHRNSASGDHAHGVNSDCLSCHKHLNGFLPEQIDRQERD